ncbi:hypothetical protein EXIGLDRAFT_627870, partial [Exidia glandulosa HHB12029]
MKHIKIASELDSFPAVNTYLKEHGLNYVLEPFWKEWAHVNIHDAITPDILHQLYQGVIKHLVKWLQKLIGKKELDARMQRTPKVHGLRSFEKGISVLQRISGTEHKAIAKQLLPNVADGQIDRRVVRATRAILDFTRIASYECHSDDTLVDLEKALSVFHENKDVFIELGACKALALDLPKIHSLQHYPRSVRLVGSLKNCNTETGERLHIDSVKDGYAASNKKIDQVLKQICRWLEWRERMRYLARFLAW